MKNLFEYMKLSDFDSDFSDYSFNILDFIRPENSADYNAFAVTEDGLGENLDIADLLPQLATTQR